MMKVTVKMIEEAIAETGKRWEGIKKAKTRDNMDIVVNHIECGFCELSSFIRSKVSQANICESVCPMNEKDVFPCCKAWTVYTKRESLCTITFEARKLLAKLATLNALSLARKYNVYLKGLKHD